MKRKQLAVFTIVVGVIVTGAGVFVGDMALPTNCGGNTASLDNCIRYARLVHSCKLASPPSRAYLTAQSFAKVSAESIPKPSHWNGFAPYMVRTNWPDSPERTNREVVIVCSVPFDNVPQRWWHRAQCAHAAGYDDGDVGLISTSEFGRLDLQNFADTRMFVNNEDAQQSPRGYK